MSFVRKFAVSFFLLGATYAIFMYLADPYVLVGADQVGKTIPFYPWYHFNFIQKVDKLDYAFMGSSQVNYFPIQKMYPGTSALFSMGIESANIREHIAYGKMLLKKKPKEIWFFVTFYALNPARGDQKYFNASVMNLNFLPITFIYQYFHKSAFFDALDFFSRTRSKSAWTAQFNMDGTRTQKVYLDDVNYKFEKTVADYLAWIAIGPRYYDSETFRKPDSIDAGIANIKAFKDLADRNGITVRIATAPVHRSVHALAYIKGLGPTYEAFRKKLATLGPYVDLDLDIELTSQKTNFWDTHHVRNGDRVIEALKSGKFLVTLENVEKTSEHLRPREDEIEDISNILANYENWNGMRSQVQVDLSKNPAVAP